MGMAKDIILDQYIMKKNKIPVLIKDADWKNLFEVYMTKPMKKTAKELDEKVAEEKDAKKQIKAHRKLKQNLMERILKLSDEVNNNKNKEALIKLEDAKEKLLEVNDRIDEFQFKLETLPKEIELLNMELLKASIEIAYKDIEEGNKKLKTLTVEIIKLRDELKSSWDEKLNLESRVETLYSYLHNTLGHEETNKLDKKFL
jgi:small-conductance mechanosensitive channel